MFADILSGNQKEILPRLARVLREGDMYLAGGTALALQFGHRPSVAF